MIRTNNEQDVKRAYEYTQGVTGDVYTSSLMSSAVARYERRVRAYYGRPDPDMPDWKSKIQTATFWLACKSLDSAMQRAYNSDPFVFVKPSDNANIDANALEAAQIAHFDLNFDLRNSRWAVKRDRMFWYVQLFGTAIGREYVRSFSKERKRTIMKADPFGLAMTPEEVTEIEQHELTGTDVIHPLNHCHDVTVPDFLASPWSSVRFEMDIHDLYMMLGHPDYYQPGVKEAIEKIKEQQLTYSGKDIETFYSDNADSSLGRRKVIVDEYHGPIRYTGNESDTTIYYQLVIKQLGVTLRLQKTPFPTCPHWKMQAWPDPNGMWAVGPCDMVLPLKAWKDDVINQHQDFVAARMKYMYEVQAENIQGGIATLANGMPMGFVPLASGKQPGTSIAGVEMGRGFGPEFRDTMAMIESEIERTNAQSTLKGEGSRQLDTATGISLVADREDAYTRAMLRGVDNGVVDAMQSKLQFYVRFFREPKIAELKEKGSDYTRHVRHYPRELEGFDYSFDINRSSTDTESGKNLQFLKLLAEFMPLVEQKGVQVPPELLVDTLKDTAIAIGIPGADEKFEKVKSSIQPAVPPQINTQQPAPEQPLPTQQPQPQSIAGALS